MIAPPKKTLPWQGYQICLRQHLQEPKKRRHRFLDLPLPDLQMSLNKSSVSHNVFRLSNCTERSSAMITSPPILHPSVRERPTPRMSAVSLAEYLILRSDAQDTVLHDFRYSRPPIVNAYSDAFRALRAYNTDPRRIVANLDLVKESLARRADLVGIKPKGVREEALRCIEAIGLFQGAENNFGLRALPLLESPRFLELKVEGVALSIQPDFVVQTIEIGAELVP